MAKHHISQFFVFAQLRPELQPTSRQFTAAHDIIVSEPGPSFIRMVLNDLTTFVGTLPDNEERAVCLQKLQGCQHATTIPGVLRLLIEAKDCAVRAVLAKPVEEDADITAVN